MGFGEQTADGSGTRRGQPLIDSLLPDLIVAKD